MSSNGNNLIAGTSVSAPAHDSSTFESPITNHITESRGPWISRYRVNPDRVLQGRDDTQRTNNFVEIPVGGSPAPSSSFSCVTETHGEIERGEIVKREPPTKLAILGMWSWEFVAVVISSVAFAVTAGLLAGFNEKLQPNFEVYININTIVAISSAVMRATMVFVLAEVMGQWKWLWMEEPRALRRIDYVDHAGRGVWGSFKVLLRVWESKVTLFCALIVIVSHGIGPFSQQAVKTSACSTKIPGTATVAYAKWISWTDAGAESARLVPELQAVALNGLLFGADFDFSSSLFQCTSGNCTFGLQPGTKTTHSTVGFCSRCADVTPDLRQAEIEDGNRTIFSFDGRQDFNLTWPPTGGNIFNIRSGMEGESPTKAKTSILAFRAAGCPNGNISHVEADGRTCQQRAFGKGPDRGYGSVGSDVDIVAVNCTLSPCVRRYDAVVTNGVLQESLVSEDPVDNLSVELDGGIPKFWGWNTVIEPCFVNGTWYDRFNISKATKDEPWVVWRNMSRNGALSAELYGAPLDCVRMISYPMMAAMQEYLAATLSGNCNYNSNFVPDSGRGGFMGDGDTREQIQISCKYKWWLDYLYSEGRMTVESITAAHQGMATAVSNRVRGDMNPLDGETSTVQGLVWTAAVCIRADWPWLAFPASLLVLTTCLLVTAYVQSCRHRDKRPVWKSAILPILFYGVSIGHGRPNSKGDEYETLPLLQLKELEELADKTVGHFDSDPDRPGFKVKWVDRDRKK